MNATVSIDRYAATALLNTMFLKIRVDEEEILKKKWCSSPLFEF